MLQQTLKLLRLWRLLQVVDALVTQFGNIKLGDCKKRIEEENDSLMEEINNLSEAIKNRKYRKKGKDKERDFIEEIIEAIFEKKLK